MSATRLLRVTVSHELIEQFLTAGHEHRGRCVKGLPKGAWLIGVGLAHVVGDIPSRDVELTFEVPGGDSAAERIEQFNPAFEEIR